MVRLVRATLELPESLERPVSAPAHQSLFLHYPENRHDFGVSGSWPKCWAFRTIGESSRDRDNDARLPRRDHLDLKAVGLGIAATLVDDFRGINPLVTVTDARSWSDDETCRALSNANPCGTSSRKI
jgi:hypothetical protein